MKFLLEKVLLICLYAFLFRNQFDNVVFNLDLVYTFFHPLLKDEEETNIHIHKLKGTTSDYTIYFLI